MCVHPRSVRRSGFTRECSSGGNGERRVEIGQQGRPVRGYRLNDKSGRAVTLARLDGQPATNAAKDVAFHMPRIRQHRRNTVAQRRNAA